MSRTISIPDTEARQEPREQIPWDASVRSLLHQTVEQMGPDPGGLVVCNDRNALAQAAHDAFYEHRPLVLTPDAVWFCIVSGFAHHVNLNAESLRDRFVRHEGKEVLTVKRLDFVLGQHNPWPEVFEGFSDLLAEHVGGVRDLIVADFSTTGVAERAASEIVLLDTFQAYFEYVLMAGCGIPSFTLRGTPEDWRRIRERAALLAEWGLEDWISVLTPVLDKLVAAAEGEDDLDFWRSFFRYQAASGPAELSGWIHVLFPYLKEGDALRPNTHLDDWSERIDELARLDAAGAHWTEYALRGPHISVLPPSLASAPLRVVFPSGDEVQMRMVGGMFGVREGSDGLEPVFSWAVVYGSETGTRWEWRRRP
ncbi:MAG: DUF4419 domain-containing protein [Myxococcales bacterium]|nr:DUF4419 domain-containing protein [Myxococcales bacterium]